MAVSLLAGLIAGPLLARAAAEQTADPADLRDPDLDLVPQNRLAETSTAGLTNRIEETARLN